MSIDMTPKMGRDEGSVQVYCQESDRRPLSEIYNNPSSEEARSANPMEKDVLKISKVLLTRIDPSLRPKKIGVKDEDDPWSKDGDPTEVDMKIEQGGDVPTPSN